jgi:hypothetical protein
MSEQICLLFIDWLDLLITDIEIEIWIWHWYYTYIFKGFLLAFVNQKILPH